MNNPRRGTRTRRPSASNLGSPPNDGNPDAADASTSDDANDRTSEGGTQDSNKDENTSNGSDSSADAELSGSDASRSNDADDEDTNDWNNLKKNLATERKRRQDAQRKITEQGNEKKTLEETLKNFRIR